MGPPVERLQDFQLLTHGKGYIFHLFLRLNLQVILIRKFLCHPDGFPSVHLPGISRFCTKNQIFSHRHGRHLHKMLMNHSQSRRNGIAGGRKADFLPLYKNLPFRRRQHAEQHFHQRGFSRAVLSYQRMDFSPSDLQIDVMVGHNAAGIYLGNIPGLKDVSLLHMFFLHD